MITERKKKENSAIIIKEKNPAIIMRKSEKTPRKKDTHYVRT